MLSSGDGKLFRESRHLPVDLVASYPEIPWQEVRAIGNMLRHGYHRIADEEIWSVVTDDLPPLKAAIEAIRRDLKN